ncbi:hypothetical protein ACJX0J_036316 [Zea mays]
MAYNQIILAKIIILFIKHQNPNKMVYMVHFPYNHHNLIIQTKAHDPLVGLFGSKLKENKFAKMDFIPHINTSSLDCSDALEKCLVASLEKILLKKAVVPFLFQIGAQSVGPFVKQQNLDYITRLETTR